MVKRDSRLSDVEIGIIHTLDHQVALIIEEDIIKEKKNIEEVEGKDHETLVIGPDPEIKKGTEVMITVAANAVMKMIEIIEIVEERNNDSNSTPLNNLNQLNPPTFQVSFFLFNLQLANFYQLNNLFIIYQQMMS